MNSEYSLDNGTLKQQIETMPDNSILFRSDFPEYHAEFVGSVLSELTAEGILVTASSQIRIIHRYLS